MADDRTDQGRRGAEWARSDRCSCRIALAIALGPIPICLLISWALGSPPWRGRPAPDRAEARFAEPDREWRGPPMAHR